MHFKAFCKEQAEMYICPSLWCGARAGCSTGTPASIRSSSDPVIFLPKCALDQLTEPKQRLIHHLSSCLLVSTAIPENKMEYEREREKNLGREDKEKKLFWANLLVAFCWLLSKTTHWARCVCTFNQLSSLFLLHQSLPVGGMHPC